MLTDSPRPVDPTARTTSGRDASTRAEMVARYADSLGVDLAPSPVVLPSGACVMVDGANPSGTLFVEAHGATGPLGHLDLVRLVQDVFKLAMLRHDHPDSRTVVLVADEAARDDLAARIARTPAAELVEIVVPT